jgi:plasmid stabilization system protein ParE
MPELSSGRYTYHAWAAAELFEATRYYMEQGGTLGGDFLDEVERGIAFILENPEGAPVISAEGVRRKVLARFPYSLLYCVEPERIRIVTVMHHKRRPGYWAGRL